MGSTAFSKEVEEEAGWGAGRPSRPTSVALAVGFLTARPYFFIRRLPFASADSGLDPVLETL